MTGSAHRKLVLLRHAKSAWPDLPDHDRPLAGRGRRDAPVMGRWLRKAGHAPDQVLCSTARRARQTWQLAQPAVKAAPPVSFEDRIYLASAGQLLDLVRQAPRAAQTFLLAGPTSPAGGGIGIAPPAAFERMKAKFPTAAIAVLELTGTWRQLGPGTARLASFVIPRDVGTGKPAGR